MDLIKPARLYAGDTIATVSPCNGWAGDQDHAWKYNRGKQCLESLYKLNAQPAPNSMRGSEFLSKNPQARAEDIMWAFENKDIKAVIANVGGNDSIKLLPYIDTATIKNNPKIFIGMSDVMNINILCLKAGLSTFYGPNLFSETDSYSQNWFRKTLFDTSVIETIYPRDTGHELVQGQGIVRGKLIGGHTGITWLENEPIALATADFDGSILFVEDIPEFFSPSHVRDFLLWLAKKDFLHRINGIIIGKLGGDTSFANHKAVIQNTIGNECGLKDLPVLYGLNFGHILSSFILPYGAKAEINCEAKTFSILESGVTDGSRAPCH